MRILTCLFLFLQWNANLLEAFISSFPLKTFKHNRFLNNNHKDNNISPSKTFSTKHPPKIFCIKKGDNDDDDDTIFYDDFDDFIGNDDDNDDDVLDNPVSSLLQKSHQEDFRRNLRLQENWRMGNWKVRGFALEKRSSSSSPQSDDEEEVRSNSISQVALNRASESSIEDSSIVIGRADGSIVLVRLGTEYLATFQSVSMVTMDDEKNTIRVSSELVRSKEENGEESDENDDDSMTPFKIMSQIQAHDNNEAISELLMEDDVLYTTAGGKIKEWGVVDEQIDNVPRRELNAHDQPIHALKFISKTKDKQKLLLSVSYDGSVALWDRSTGQLLKKLHLSNNDEGTTSILSADVDILDDETTVIYLGLETGYVVGYTLEQLLHLEDDVLLPDEYCCNIRAHDKPVTAIRCWGRQIMQSKISGKKEVGVLLTGGGGGDLKQWDIIPQKHKTTLKLEHWPRLKTQRLQNNRAHTFQSQHHGPISSITTNTANNIILTCASDGQIILHSPYEGGKKLYSMHGFTSDINSLTCVGKSVLVTNGMDQFVCLHDFDVKEIEEEEELEDMLDFDF